MPWAVWGHCTGGSSPREVRDLPSPCHSRPGPEGAPTPRFRGRERGSAGHDPEREVPQTHPRGGALARPNHCPREGGCLANSTGLRRAPTAILRGPPIPRGSLLHPESSPAPAALSATLKSPVLFFLSCILGARPTSPPRVVRSWSQVTRRRGRGLFRARRFLWQPVQTSWSGVGGCDDAGLQAPNLPNLRLSDRGRPLRPGAARAAGE